MTTYVCLICGHVRHSKSEPKDGGQCPICHSFWPIEKTAYEKMVDELAQRVNDNTPIADTLMALALLFRNYGIQARPIQTLIVARNLVEKAEKRKRSE